MALRNLDAATNPDIIGLDLNPTLTIANATVGPGLKVDKLLVTGTATIAGAISTATITSTATALPALTLVRGTQVGNMSTALLNLWVSGASVPVFNLQASAFTSIVSIVFAASGNWAGLGAIRVTYSDNITAGWIPIIPNASVTAATAT